MRQFQQVGALLEFGAASPQLVVRALAFHRHRRLVGNRLHQLQFVFLKNERERVPKERVPSSRPPGNQREAGVGRDADLADDTRFRRRCRLHVFAHHPLAPARHDAAHGIPEFQPPQPFRLVIAYAARRVQPQTTAVVGHQVVEVNLQPQMGGKSAEDAAHDLARLIGHQQRAGDFREQPQSFVAALEHLLGRNAGFKTRVHRRGYQNSLSSVLIIPAAAMNVTRLTRIIGGSRSPKHESP